MERYTPQAKEALSLAVGVAESLNHGYVGTEHLLIGLLQEGTGVAAKVLEENGVEEDKVVELPAHCSQSYPSDSRYSCLYSQSPPRDRKQLSGGCAV